MATNEIIAFQTGRHYAPKGQRIAATRLADGTIAFYDIDRGIRGVITTAWIANHYLDLDKESVMWIYDRSERFHYWEYSGAAYDMTWDILKEAAEAL